MLAPIRWPASTPPPRVPLRPSPAPLRTPPARRPRDESSQGQSYGGWTEELKGSSAGYTEPHPRRSGPPVTEDTAQDALLAPTLPTPPPPPARWMRIASSDDERRCDDERRGDQGGNDDERRGDQGGNDDEDDGRSEWEDEEGEERRRMVETMVRGQEEEATG